MSNRTWIIVILLIVVVIIVAYGLREKFTDKGPPYTAADAEKGIKAIVSKYGAEMAATIEKMYRLETAHFTSEQYRLTGTGGMTAGNWADIPELSFKVSALPTVRITGNPYAFLVFPSVEKAMIYKAEYIKRNGGNYARWYSSDASEQIGYRSKIAGIQATYTEAYG